MNTRTQMLLIIAILVVAFVISSGLFFDLRSQATAIEGERQVLTRLRMALLDEGFQANRLGIERVGPQVQNLHQALARTSAEFRRVRSLRVLPRVSPKVRRALKAINDEQDLLNATAEKLLSGLHELEQDAGLLEANTMAGNLAYTMVSLATETQSQDAGRLAELTGYEIGAVQDDIGALTTEIDTANEVITAQGSVIELEIRRAERRSEETALAVILLVVGGTILLALGLTNRIVRSVRSIEERIGLMKEGDLTVTFSASSGDEIGRLSANLTGFIGSLGESLKTVQSVSSAGMELKGRLLTGTERAARSAAQIASRAVSITERVADLDSGLLSSNSAVGDIAKSITNLDAQIQEQMAMVEQSSAAVTEMISSFDTMTNTAERRQEAVKHVVELVGRGGRKMAATFRAVEQIQENAGTIKGVTALLEEISAQTGLLAMNAAIEAVHAGEAGKGFGVVAEEVRKLAEASSRSSLEIATALNTILERVRDAAASSEEMNLAFSEIDREVGELSRSLAEIFSGMGELRSGSAQIFDAMARLRHTSTKVLEGSRTINASSAAIKATTVNLGGTSTEVRAGMEEIARGTKDISSAVDEVLRIAERLGALSETLNRGLARFRTEGKQGAA